MSLLKRLGSKEPEYPIQPIEGGLTPEQMGLPFPEVRMIFIGYCGGEGKDKHNPIGGFNKMFPIYTFGGAHTHFCKGDKFYRCICVSHGNLVWNSDKTPSGIMWHEYGHILSKSITCKMHQKMTEEDLQVWGHGKDFQKVMKKLGQSEFDRRYLPLPY